MNEKRSQSSQRRRTKNPKKNAKIELFHIQQRAFSNPKYQNILKQKIKMQRKELKVDLSNYMPVKLNFEINKDNSGTDAKLILRDKIIKNFQILSQKA